MAGLYRRGPEAAIVMSLVGGETYEYVGVSAWGTRIGRNGGSLVFS